MVGVDAFGRRHHPGPADDHPARDDGGNGGFGYADGGTVTGRFAATEPFTVEIDPEALR